VEQHGSNHRFLVLFYESLTVKYILDKLERQEGVLMIDACQGRLLVEEMKYYLSLTKNVIIMITGSKFWRAPSFAGATM